MKGLSKEPYQQGGKLRQFLLANVGAAGLFALIALAYFLLLYRPGLINRDFPVTLPENRTLGTLGETLVNKGLELRVEDVERLPSMQFADTVRAASRAKPDRLTDYVIVLVSLHNLSDEPKTLQYYGSGQDIEFLLGTRRPSPDVKLAALPRETASIVQGEALTGGGLAPGKQVSGYLVFPTNKGAKELSLLVIPNRYRSVDAELSTFEVRLEPPE